MTFIPLNQCLMHHNIFSIFFFEDSICEGSIFGFISKTLSLCSTAVSSQILA